MSLFQKSVEKKYLSDLDSALIEKKHVGFQNYFGNPERQENIRNSKEEQFQEGFLRELFVNILGYTLNPEPNFNLTTELKNISNSKKADGAILKGEDATAVIELKGTETTDLDKIETQAFGYRNHHPRCIYVITSNFEKLRFYIQNADFLYMEICYFESRTKNPDLRRKVSRTFQNICILIAYLEFEIEDYSLLKDVTYFIEKLDFNVSDVYTLAHPLLVKPNIFDTNDIVQLIKVLISRRNLYEGYLLVTCLYTLRDKGYIFPKSEETTVNSLLEIAIKNPRYGMIKAISETISNNMKISLNDKIQTKLEEGFNHELFYQSVISKSIKNPKQFIDSYLKFINPISEKKEIPSIFYAKSPYTGIGEPLREHLNNLVNVIISLSDKSLLEKQVIQDIVNRYPYYEFIFNIDNFYKENPFDKFWILENQSEIVLNQIAKNIEIKSFLKEALSKQYNKELSKIFVKYFTD